QLSLDLNARPQHVAAARSGEAQAQPMGPVAVVVDEETRWAVEICNDDVGVAVVVDVTEGRPAAGCEDPEGGAGLVGDICELAVPGIAKQEIALLERKRVVPSSLLAMQRPVHGQDVEPAVVVEVDPR